MSLLHDLVHDSAHATPDGIALIYGEQRLSYAELAGKVGALALALCAKGLKRGERVAIYLEKRPEAVIACFGAANAGAAFVPINPLLKTDQVTYILRDCDVRVLITSRERLRLLQGTLPQCSSLRQVALVDGVPEEDFGIDMLSWEELVKTRQGETHRAIDADMAAILYTSGSTGHPKGVMLSHRNMVAGARSVASYLRNHRGDILLAALPLSFDAGFSQLSTAFYAQATVVLINYLVPRDVLQAVVRERVTGVTAVPPLWIQLSQLQWPEEVTNHLRYIANTGGRMPVATLNVLRRMLPNTKPYLMYGLTEAFRATYLPPEQLDRRPDSIGKAIPNSEVLVLREDGTPCAPNEPGELVQRGALVAMGYWNDPERTAERFKPLPGREPGLVLPEIAVFSGDTVRMDEDGFLYFIGRRDEMIKTSGYRVSPTEVEEVLYASQLVGEAVAFGVPHPTLGQAIVAIATPKSGSELDQDRLLSECRSRLPTYMVPAHLVIQTDPLPRNHNGKIDRKDMALRFQGLFEQPA